MPKPIFILCSESQSQDRRSNLLSVFNIIERVEVKAQAKPTDEPKDVVLVEMLSFAVTAVWRRTEDDADGDEYDSEMVLHLPGPEDKKLTKDTGPFTLGPLDKPLQRITLLVKMPMIKASGKLVAESRIRKKGTDDWLSQTYVLPVIFDESPDSDVDPNAGKNGEG
jgi:hypothetical protein